MSANTLVAFCVGCLFLLAAITVSLSFWERRAYMRVARPRSDFGEQVTAPHPPIGSGWPEHKE